MPDERPYLAAALMCERVLEEKDRVLSVIRIVDNYFVQASPEDLPKEAKPLSVFSSGAMFQEVACRTSAGETHCHSGFARAFRQDNEERRST